MKDLHTNLLYFNPQSDIIINKKIKQVALIIPLDKSWVKISYNAYQTIKKLKTYSIFTLLENKKIDEESKDQFVSLVNHLFSNKYLVTLADHNNLKKSCIVNGYAEMTKSNLPELSKKVYLSLTSSCNLRCIHCYNTVNQPVITPIEEGKIIYDIIEKMRGNNVTGIILTGGEPFLRKDIFKIIEKTREITKEITINTNSLLLNNQIIQSLKKYDNLTIAVSLDGLTKETHEKIRGKNTFDNTIANIKLLIKSGVKTHIISTLTKINFKELIDFDIFIKEIGATGNLSFFTPVGKGKESISNLIMDDNAIREYTELLLNKSKRNKTGQKIKGKNHDLPVKFNCSAGIGILGIEHIGRVVPCHLFLGKDVSLGNILNESLLDMQLRWINKGILSVDNNSGCQNCSIRHFCGNGCLANRLYSNGSADTKDPNCSIHQAGIENRLWDCEN